METERKSNRGGRRPGAGRKKGFAALEAERMRHIIAVKLSEHFEPIVDIAIRQAKRGNKDARSWLVDRVFGRPTQALELSGKDGKPLFNEEHIKKTESAITKFLGDGTGVNTPKV